MGLLKQTLLNLWAGICLLVFTITVVDIVFFWFDAGFEWVYLGKKSLYAVATGYWVWRLLIEPYRQRKTLEAKRA